MPNRARLQRAWKLFNPIALRLAGFMPWWVIVETTGRKSGKVRRVPLGSGPKDGNGMLLFAVHGRHAAWVLNAEANPSVRLRHLGKWRSGTATVSPFDADQMRRFNLYVRSAMRIADDPLLVQVTFT